MTNKEPTFTREEVSELFEYQRRLYTNDLEELRKSELIETILENEKSFRVGLDELYWKKRATNN